MGLANELILNREFGDSNLHSSCLSYLKEREDGPFIIRPLKNLKELQDVFRFRYQIYVNEMKRSEKWANHELETLEEPMDRTASLFGAYHNGELCGIGRLNFARTSTIEHSEFLEFGKFKKEFANNVVFISRLMISQKVRRTSLFLDLCKFILARSVEEGVEVGILNCNYALLIKMFRQIGFRQYREAVLHPDYGLPTTPMAFYVNDVDYLEEIKSPLLSSSKSATGQYFYGAKNEKVRNYFRELESRL